MDAMWAERRMRRAPVLRFSGGRGRPFGCENGGEPVGAESVHALWHTGNPDLFIGHFLKYSKTIYKVKALC